MKVVVVGAGASGLVSAIVALRNGNEVTILERLSKCGKKLSVTGNGKCNYYNLDQNISHYHSSKAYFLKEFIHSDNDEAVRAFFDSIGIVPIEKNGYCYPSSNQAISVVRALESEVMRLGGKIIYDIFVCDIEKEMDSFIVKTDKGNYFFDRVIMASGSYAYYKDMEINSYDILRELGHHIIKPRPALVQLVSDEAIVKKWSGVRSEVVIQLYQNERFISEERGEILLTSYGVSGICSMQVSRYVAFKKQDDVFRLHINFIPHLAMDEDSCYEFLEDYIKRTGDRMIGDVLDNLVNYKLGNAILDRLGIKNDVMYSKLSLEDLKKVIVCLVNFQLNLSGTKSFLEAQVCSGGVDLEEIDLKTMESKIVKGLYVVGEVLDIDGDCGGYNLNIAWISGILAGSNVGSVSC